jgi:uncharacterized LabA/DUF88 family protein
MKSKAKRGNYAFIDSQNLHLSVRAQGWRIDYRRWRKYLTDKYQVRKALIFIGYVKENQQLYSFLQECGFTLVFKPTIAFKRGGRVCAKGNVDAELVLYAAAKEYRHYEKAIIVSGDGDFACLIKFLLERGKLERVLTPSAFYSHLLDGFRDKISILSNVRQKIDQVQRSVETLGLPGRGDGLILTRGRGNVKVGKERKKGGGSKVKKQGGDK